MMKLMNLLLKTMNMDKSNMIMNNKNMRRPLTRISMEISIMRIKATRNLEDEQCNTKL